MAKPQILQQLTHDKLLAKPNFPQFVETFNYTVNRCENLKGDDDFVGRRGLINVDNTDPEHPIIRCNYDNLPEIVGDVLPDAELAPEAYLSAGVEGLSSIQYRTLASADTDTPGKVLELFGFDDPTASAPLSDDSFVVRRDGSRVSYVSMSALLSAVSSSISGGGGGGGPSVPGPFEMTLSGQNASFKNCVMRVARAYFFYDDMTCTVPAGDQMVYSVLQHSETPSVTVSAGPYSDIAGKLGTNWSNLLSTTVTPLYRVTDGEVKCDYRYMMNVQAYDSRNYSGWVG